MSALPRPDLPPGPHRDLAAALHDLHHRAGWPSLRTLAREAGVSHTTVSKVFSTPTIPAWGTLEVLIEAMAGDIAAFHDLWLDASTPAGGHGREAPRIAGRKAELTAVRHHLETGRGLLLVTGEAGMGKTKLVTTAAAASDTFVATGACLPLSSAVPLLPVAEALRLIHDSDGGRWSQQALAGCSGYVAASLARVLPEIAHLVDQPDPDDDWARHRLYSAVAAVLAALRALQPVAIVIEDLHWADPATLDLVENLLSREPRLAAVGTWRTDDPTTSPTHQEWFQRLARGTHVSCLALEPLSREETADQLRLIHGRIDETTVDRVHARSLGLPLFTEQLGTENTHNLPRLLEDVLDTRLDGLPDDAWRAARTLAVAGRGLPDDVLAEASGLGSEVVVAALHSLRDRRLLRTDQRTPVAELRHPLLGEAVRRRLVPGEAADTHRRLAVALAARSSVPAAEVATHWQGAGDEASELAWRIRAAGEACSRFAHGTEADQWLRALELWPGSLTEAGEPSLTRVRASIRAMYALEFSSRTREASALVDTLLYGPAPLDPLDKGELYMLAADYAGVLEDADRALALADKGLGLLGPLAPPLDLINALRTRAWLRQDVGLWEEAEADIAEALALNEVAQDPFQQRRLLATQGWFDFAAGRREQALERLALAALAPSQPDPLGDTYIAMVHTDVLLQAGAPPAEVAAAGARALRAIDELRIDSQAAATTRANVAEAWLLAGAVRQAAAALGHATEGDYRQEYWALHMTRATIDLLQGRLDLALARVGEMEQHALGAHAQRVYLAEVNASALLWAGRPVEAWACLRPILRGWVENAERTHAGAMFVLGARAAVEATAGLTGRENPVAAIRALLADMPGDVFEVTVSGLGPAHAATFAAELSRIDKVRHLDPWLGAAAAWDSLTRPHDAAYCRWRAAQVAIRDAQGTVAARLLKRAARDAREHVPLSEAIATTAATSS